MGYCSSHEIEVITYDDLSEFSGELQQEVKRMIEICKK